MSYHPKINTTGNPSNSSSLISRSSHPESLYLARTILTSPCQYSLCLSYWNQAGNCYCHRHLFDLGESPDSFLVYPNDSSFYVQEDLEYQLNKLCGFDVADRLEDLLWPFVSQDIQIKMSHFRRKSTTISAISKEEKEAIRLNTHIFDKRRLYFLNYGAGNVSQDRLDRMSPRLGRKILNKSRDEREQWFLEQEKNLFEDELKLYLFVALDLQQYFPTMVYTRTRPHTLNQEKVDKVFVKELCQLDSDKELWQGAPAHNCLNNYLRRYLIYFFDLSYTSKNPDQDPIRQFMNNHRQFRWPDKKQTVAKEEMATIFGKPMDELKKLNKEELTRLYRRKAKALHPDTGGDHDLFVRLTEAFNQLLASASS